MRAGAIITGTRLDPLVAFAELGRMKLDESDLQAVLGRVAELASHPMRPASGIGSARTAAGSRSSVAKVMDDLAE